MNKYYKEYQMIRELVHPGNDVVNNVEDADWDFIVKVTNAHNIINILSYKVLLKKIPISLIHKAKLRLLLRMTEQRQKVMSSELALIISAFNKHGVEHILLKGPVLSNLVYPDTTMRSYSDIDILVPIEVHDKAYKILEELGYGQIKFNDITGEYEEASAQEKESTIKYQHAYPYTKLSSNTTIEVHRTIDIFVNPNIVNEFFKNKTAFIFNGQNTWRLSNEDLLLHACISNYHDHACEEGFVLGINHKVGRIYDILYIIEALKNDLNWDRFLNISDSYEKTAMYYSLKQANIIYPGIVPDYILKNLKVKLSPKDKIQQWIEVKNFSSKNNNLCNRMCYVFKDDENLPSTIIDYPKIAGLNFKINQSLHANTIYNEEKVRFLINDIDIQNRYENGVYKFLYDSEPFNTSFASVKSIGFHLSKEIYDKTYCKIEGSIIEHSNQVEFITNISNLSDKVIENIEQEIVIYKIGIWSKKDFDLIINTDSGQKIFNYNQGFIAHKNIDALNNYDYKNKEVLEDNFLYIIQEEENVRITLEASNLKSVENCMHLPLAHFILLKINLGTLMPNGTTKGVLRLIFNP